MPDVKCVVWDLDGTLWDGIAVEGDAATPPPLFPGVVEMLDALEGRGIVNSVASRSAPLVAQMLDEHPVLSGKFLAVNVGWGDKSDSVRRIAAELGVGLDAIAVVDDSAFERAEIAAKLPDVTVLSPDEVRASIDRPPFVPQQTSSESGLRVRRLREEGARRAEQAARGLSREEFLESCEMRLTFGPADASEVDRIAELVSRANRLSSSGMRPDREEVRRRMQDGTTRVLRARLSDRFGDYGLIGVAFVDPGAPAWSLPLIAVSCRAAGRGVAEAMLGSIVREARDAGATEVRVDVVDSPANLELRILLRSYGFRLAGETSGPVIPLARRLDGPPPEVPAWIDLRRTG